MARMLGKKVYDYNRDDDDPIPKSRVRNEETREWMKDVEDESVFDQECPHGLSVTDIIAGRKACYECWCLARGLDPWTEPEIPEGAEYNG